MLNSIREIFDIAGIPFESLLFIEAKFDNESSIIDAIDNQRLCPAIVGAKFNFSAGSIDCAHVMVAAGVQSVTVGSLVTVDFPVVVGFSVTVDFLVTGGSLVTIGFSITIFSSTLTEGISIGTAFDVTEWGDWFFSS